MDILIQIHSQELIYIESPKDHFHSIEKGQEIENIPRNNIL